jgi:hypothetical protein
MKRVNELKDELHQMNPEDNDHIVNILLDIVDEMKCLDARVTKQEKLMTKTVKKG